MKNPFKKSDQSAAIRERLAKLQAGAQQVAQRRDVAASRLDDARERRRALIRDGAEVAEDLRKGLVSVEMELRSLEDEASEFAAAIEECRAELAHEEQRGERERRAAELEMVATATERAAKAVGAAANAFASAVKDLEASLPLIGPEPSTAGGRPQNRRHSGPLTASESAAIVAAEALANAAPALFDEHNSIGWGSISAITRFFDLSRSPEYRFPGGPVPEPLSAVDAARELISDRLRAMAAEIRSGQRPLDLGQDTPPIEQDDEGAAIDPVLTGHA